jgi:ABC-type branched-subunit amino acid transport system ATPase component
MKALMGLSDRVLIMHYGQKLFEGLPEEAGRNPEVLKVYLGK